MIIFDSEIKKHVYFNKDKMVPSARWVNIVYVNVYAHTHTNIEVLGI